MKKKRFPYHIVIIIIIVFAVTAAATYLVKDWFDKSKPVVEVKSELDVKTIEESIRMIAELATLSYNYTDVCVFSEQRTLTLFGVELAIPGTSKSFVICYDGEIKIGIDASQISMSAGDGFITLSMPQAKVLSHAIDESSVMLLDEKSGLFNPISVNDYTSFITEQKQKMEEKARSNDMFAQAQTNAEEQVKALLMQIPDIAEEYTISFKY